MAGFVLHGNMFKAENPSYNKDSVEVSGVEALAAVSLGEDKAAVDEEDKVSKAQCYSLDVFVDRTVSSTRGDGVSDCPHHMDFVCLFVIKWTLFVCFFVSL